MKNLAEKVLWNALKDGDLKALEVLFKSYYSPLFCYGLKISNNGALTKDCLQDFFLYIYEHRDNLADLDNLKPYLFTAFRRKLIKMMKEKRVRQGIETITPNDLGFHFSKEDIIVDQEIKDFKRDNLIKSLNDLPKKQKEIIYLKYYGNLSIKEIAVVLDINYQSVVNSLHKTIKRLRQDVTLKNILKDFIVKKEK